MRPCSIALLLACLGAGGCATATPDLGAPVNPLQLREAQSRSYATDDAALLMKAVLATLQDEGFVIRSADAQLGLVTASRETVRPPGAGARAARWASIVFTYGLAALAPAPEAGLALLEATANVTRFGPESRLRISFQLKVTGGGSLKESRALTDPALYQEFLAKVDKALFVLKEKL